MVRGAVGCRWSGTMNPTNSNLNFSPYRVKRRRDPGGAPLTEPQRRVLAALCELCPGAAGDVTSREVSAASGVRLGSAIVILRSLAQRRLAMRLEGDLEAGEVEGWAPTMTGRARARHFIEAHRAPAVSEPEAEAA
jgi:hypothetical protein